MFMPMAVCIKYNNYDDDVTYTTRRIYELAVIHHNI